MIGSSNNNHLEGNSPIMITNTIVKGYQNIMFSGRLVYGSTQVAKQQVQTQLIEAKGYIFNMSKLGYIDSTGLGLIMSLAKQLNVKGKKIVIMITDKFIKEIFEIAKFQLVFPIVDSESQALDVLETNEKTSLSIDEY